MSVIVCERCGSENVRKRLTNISESEGVRYFDIILICNSCGFSKTINLAKSPEIPKETDEAKTLAAGLKLSEYMPEASELEAEKAERISVFSAFKGLDAGKLGSAVLGGVKELLVVVFALLLGVMVQIGNIRLHNYLLGLQVDPIVGFTLQLIFFIFGPIIIVGYIVYRFTKDLPKAIFLGALAVPVTIVLLELLSRMGVS